MKFIQVTVFRSCRPYLAKQQVWNWFNLPVNKYLICSIYLDYKAGKLLRIINFVDCKFFWKIGSKIQTGFGNGKGKRFDRTCDRSFPPRDENLIACCNIIYLYLHQFQTVEGYFTDNNVPLIAIDLGRSFLRNYYRNLSLVSNAIAPTSLRSTQTAICGQNIAIIAILKLMRYIRQVFKISANPLPN